MAVYFHCTKGDNYLNYYSTVLFQGKDVSSVLHVFIVYRACALTTRPQLWHLCNTLKVNMNWSFYSHNVTYLKAKANIQQEKEWDLILSI